MEDRANINLNLISLIADRWIQIYVTNLVGVNQSTVSRVMARNRETKEYKKRLLTLQRLHRGHATENQLQQDLTET